MLGGFARSCVNEFRPGTNKTSFYSFWIVIDMSEVDDLIQFVLMDRSKRYLAFSLL